MKSSLFLLSSAAQVVLSSPLKNNVQQVTVNRAVTIDKPSNFFLEKDLDREKSWTPGGTVTTIKYGPFEVPAMGMLENVWSYNQPKPCSDCYIVALQGDLTFEDGKTANIEDGAWLHHTVLYSGLGFTPGSKADLVCSNTLLSFGMGWPHRIFASGNERTPVRLNSKYKFGLPLDASENMHIMYDLVNLKDKPQKFVLTMTFEHIPKSTPGYKAARMIWADITGCGASEAKPLEGVYELKSPGWNSTVGGVLLATLGHVHDGGIYTTLYVNDKAVCRSDQFYNTKPGFTEKAGIPNLSGEEMMKAMGGHGLTEPKDNAGQSSKQPAGPLPAKPMAGGHSHGNGRAAVPTEVSAKGLEHISAASSCNNFAIIRPGDNIQLGATYDTKTHFMNRNMHGHEVNSWSSIVAWLTTPSSEKYAPIMGINPLYVGEGQMTLD